MDIESLFPLLCSCFRLVFSDWQEFGVVGNVDFEVSLSLSTKAAWLSKELMNAKVAERQADSAKKYLLEKLNGFFHININAEYNDTLSIGTCITLWAIFKDKADNIIRLGSDALGEKGTSSEEVGKEAAQKLVNEINSKAPVDVHLADNLIPVLGIVGGKIKVSEISNHTLTNIYTTELFIEKKFNVDKENRIISVD